MYNKKFIPVANPYLDSKERKAVNFVVGKKWITMGKKDYLNKFFNGICSLINLGSSTQDGTPFIKQECIDSDLLASNKPTRVNFEK